MGERGEGGAEGDEEATCFLLFAFVSGCLLFISEFSVSWSVFLPLLPFLLGLIPVCLTWSLISNTYSGDRRTCAGPAAILVSIMSLSLFLASRRKNGGPEGFHPKASLEPSFCSLLWRVFVWLCPFFHGPPPFCVGGGGGSVARIWGRQRRRPCTQHSRPSAFAPAPATPSPSPGPSPTSCSSAHSACWACPLPRPSPMPSSCCSR